jgi:Nucleotidyl transferase AbiEii toxin, Type IV TA system
MTPLTLQDVLTHQASVPWPELYQVEQDLLLSLSMRAIFDDPFLSAQVAMRGGTVLHKIHLAPAARYSEDIDLVVVGKRPEVHIRKALMRALRPPPLNQGRLSRQHLLCSKGPRAPIRGGCGLTLCESTVHESREKGQPEF